jgi:hypothetical protein
VVLPAPRNPVTTVAGILACMVVAPSEGLHRAVRLA